MGHVNEGGMHFIHYGQGIEKKEFEFDNKYASSRKKQRTDISKTIFYRGKTCQVISVQQVKNNGRNRKKKISPQKLDECNCAIGYKMFCDLKGKKHISILLMHRIGNGFKLDSPQKYVLRMSHSFKTVDVMVEVAINKDHSVPVRNCAKKTRIEINKYACWVASCIPVPETKSLIKKENNRYRVDYSVCFDSGMEVKYQLSLAEEELNNALIEEGPWKGIRNRDAGKLFLLPGFENYCEEL